MSLTTYYHATPYENFFSITREGIRKSWGGVYCSTDMNTSAKWICFTRATSKKIMVHWSLHRLIYSEKITKSDVLMLM